MFIVQGRTFRLRDDKTFNLKSLRLPNGSSLYDVKNRFYLAPDKEGNVIVQEDGKYTIRYPFTIPALLLTKSSKEKEEDTTNKDNNDIKKEREKNNSRNNPFMKFSKEYRNGHPNKKINVKELTEKWKELSDQVKQDKYGWKNTIISDRKKTIKRNKEENNNKSDTKKIKTSEYNHDNNSNDGHDDDITNIHIVKKQKMVPIPIDKEKNEDKSKVVKTENKENKIKNNNKKEEKKRGNDSFFDSLFGSDSD